jgi:hypothetical protein
VRHWWRSNKEYGDEDKSKKEWGNMMEFAIVEHMANEYVRLVPNDGCLNFVDENDEVLLAGFGRKGKAKGDIPGVRFKVVKVSGVGLYA